MTRVRRIGVAVSIVLFVASAAVAGDSLDAPTPVNPVDRLHLDWLTGEPPQYAVLAAPPGFEDDPLVGAYVMLDPEVSIAAGRRSIEAIGGMVIDEVRSLHALVVAMRYRDVGYLATEAGVRYIEPALPLFEGVNDVTRVTTSVDPVQTYPYFLDGTGIRALVYDVGPISHTHPDFAGRVTYIDSGALSDHPTHVAGTLGGSGAASGGAYRGMAPNVEFYSATLEFLLGDDCPPEYCPPGFFPWRFITNPGDIEEDYDVAIARGIDIASNSIGLAIAGHGGDISQYGDYTFTSSLIDAIVTGSLGRRICVVWAAGNEGGIGTIPPPAAAKNPIIVGAINNPDKTVASFSSGGPTDDGRIKPDVVAPGCSILVMFQEEQAEPGILSCWATDPARYYQRACGTSMATPAVAGIGCLILEQYRRMFPLSDEAADLPYNSTLRAILAHTAEDLEAPGPDYRTGYGLVQAQAAIDFMRTFAFDERTLPRSGIVKYTIKVDDGAPELRVTLAWDDPPAMPYSDPALVHDLDLVVYAPDGTRHYPWTLDPANPAAPAVRTQDDHRNIIEQVFVEDPAPGIWRVGVQGTSLDAITQSFSICGTPGLGKPQLSSSSR